MRCINLRSRCATGGFDQGVHELTYNGHNIQAEVLQILSQRVPPGTELSPETRIVQGLGLDSVAILDFIMDLEDRFDISIPLDRIAEVQTIAELSLAVETLVSAKG